MQRERYDSAHRRGAKRAQCRRRVSRRRGLPAERVAALAAADAREYLGSDAPVGAHLCDQPLIPYALAGGGVFRTLPPTLHSTTNAEVIRLLTGTSFEFELQPSGTCRVEVR